MKSNHHHSIIEEGLSEPNISSPFMFNNRIVTIIEDPNHEKVTLLNNEKNIAIQILTEFEKNYCTRAERKQLNEIIKNIKQIKLINIPNQKNESQLFCIVPTKVGGVTEKFPLMIFQKVINLLQTFNQQHEITFKICSELLFEPEAILKLPKRNDETVVISEAIALQVSRILGFKTANTTLVEYRNKPALLVLFDKIKPLTCFADGEKHRTYLTTPSHLGEIYLHNSNISPVGQDKIFPNHLLPDLGSFFAAFKLFDDPDTIGEKLQNKAFIETNSESDNLEFYIFDQTFHNSDADFTEIDSLLNLSLTTPAYSLVRHTQCRNSSIINDTSFDSKFHSIKTLFEREDDIMRLVRDLKDSFRAFCIENYVENPDELRKNVIDLRKVKLKKGYNQSYFNLLGYIITLEENLIRRFQNFLGNFPNFNGVAINKKTFNDHYESIKKAFIIQKLLNPMVLYTSDGRPCRYPMNIAIHNKIKNINIEKTDNQIEYLKLEFTENIDDMAYNRISYLKDILYKEENKTISISIPLSELESITDDLLVVFPELAPNIRIKVGKLTAMMMYNYGIPTDFIDHTYHRLGIKGFFESIIKNQPIEKNFKPSIENKDSLINVFNIYNEFVRKYTYEGLAKHIKRVMHVAIQDTICSYINTNSHMKKEEVITYVSHLNEAMTIAEDLDCVEIFHKVIILCLEKNDYKRLSLYLERLNYYNPQYKALKIDIVTQGFVEYSKEMIELLKNKASITKLLLKSDKFIFSSSHLKPLVPLKNIEIEKQPQTFFHHKPKRNSNGKEEIEEAAPPTVNKEDTNTKKMPLISENSGWNWKF